MQEISLTQANELLATLGVAAKVVEGDGDTAFDAAEATNTIYQNIPADVKKVIQEEANSAATGKTLGSLRSIIAQKFGMTKAELEDKDLKGIADALKEHTAKNSENKDFEARLAAIQEDADNRVAEVENEWKAKATQLESDLTLANQKYADRDIDAFYRTFVTKHPRTGGDENLQASSLRYQMERNGYTAKLTDKGVELWKGDKLITKPEEALKPIMDGLMPPATSTAHLKPSDVQKDGDIPGIQKATLPEYTELEQEAEAIRNWANSEI
jgi:hypothetical protein